MSPTKKTTEKLPPYLLHNKDKKLVCKIDRQVRKGEYFLAADSGSQQFVSKILLSGFSNLPSGFRRSGFGLTTVGYRILKALFEVLDRFELTVDKTAKSSVSKVGKLHKVVLSHADLVAMLDTLRRIGGEKFREQNVAIAEALFDHFPSVCSKPEKESAYRAGDLAVLLSNKSTLAKLSPKDVDTLSTFLPGFLKHFGSQINAPKKLLALSETRNAAEIIYLDKIVKDFERRLKQKAQNEHSWQAFLREYILIFNTNYASSLEKESIALQGKYPDFLLIDAYNYLDIYEIKKPNTQLLKKDESRGNYYWDVELAKANLPS
jgi:hypothetical protein